MRHGGKLYEVIRSETGTALTIASEDLALTRETSGVSGPAPALINTAFEDTVSKVLAAYLGANPVPVEQLPEVIRHISVALSAGPLAKASPANPVPGTPVIRSGQRPLEWGPATQVAASVSHDKITCLECGKQLTSLKLHLRRSHGLTPAAYMQKWKLSADYPMVSPDSTQARKRISRGGWRRCYVARD